jgi:hypothetical protein
MWPVASNTHTPDGPGIIASTRGDAFQTPETNSTVSSLSGQIPDYVRQILSA